MNLQDYINSKPPQRRVPADIITRWQTRIVARGLEKQGERGAQAYLRDYGKGIAAPKCLLLAQQALNQGHPEMAAGFYKKAAQLEGIEISDNGNIASVPARSAPAKPAEPQFIMEFPNTMQPGAFAPMQPVDASSPREKYINNSNYWGQRKIDGNKLIVFASKDRVYYQSRQMKLNGAPNDEMNIALRELAQEIGSFILEGELTYLDCNGGEHRTGSQAATYNAEHGEPEKEPYQAYFIFSSLWHSGHEMLDQSARVAKGREIATLLVLKGRSFVPLTTARSKEEKQALCDEQHQKGREGEVWFRRDLPLYAGKKTDDGYVRTKYLTEFDALVTALTDTTAQGHAFGAMVISSLDGSSLGAVGTGFTRDDKQEIKRRFTAQGRLKVKVRSQGFTEGNMAWHARFVEILE